GDKARSDWRAPTAAPSVASWQATPAPHGSSATTAAESEVPGSHSRGPHGPRSEQDDRAAARSASSTSRGRAGEESGWRRANAAISPASPIPYWHSRSSPLP